MGRRWYKRYQDFLLSPEWRALRIQVFARDGGECVRCGCQERLEAHHLDYRRLDDINRIDTLCYWCHEDWHERARYREAKKQKSRQGSGWCPKCSGRYYCEDHGG